MSPIRRIGEPDHARGTEVEARFPGRFAGRVALVTGAASGIGRATAIRLGAEGADVACLDVAEDRLDEVVEAITNDPEAPVRAIGLRCDVTDERSVAEAVAGAVSALGRPSVVCNVAGIGRFAHTTEVTMEEWNKVLAVNLTGTFLMCRATLPSLLDGGGVIVNVVSTAGVFGQPYSAAYCASKGGVALLTKALAVEYVDRGVRVNGVAPGGVDTPILWEFGLPEGADSKKLNRIMTPMGYSKPAEIAGAIAFMASDEAAYASGAILSIDGALSA